MNTGEEELIGLTDAATLMKVYDRRAAKSILDREGVSMKRIGRVWAVAESAVLAVIERNGGVFKRGRPRKKQPEQK